MLSASIFSAFRRRLQTQLQQLSNFVKSLTNRDANTSAQTSLIRDYFNLHKVIVLITRAGKVSDTFITYHILYYIHIILQNSQLTIWRLAPTSRPDAFPIVSALFGNHSGVLGSIAWVAMYKL